MPKPRAAAAVQGAAHRVLTLRIHGTANAFPGMANEAFGERKLMLAVLEDALRTLLLAKRAPVPRKRLMNELAWLESTSHAEPFAFESICDVLGIDAGYLRGRLAAGAFVPARSPRARGPRTPIRRVVDGRKERTCSVSF